MNLGIYLPSLADHDQLKDINDAIEIAIKNNKINDASIFYDDASYSPFKINCGMFNSTDLWNFSGNLIVTSLDCLYSAKNIVNNINLVYYYKKDKKYNIFTTIQAIEIPNTIICKTKEDAEYLYRISGKKINYISENFKNILGILYE